MILGLCSGRADGGDGAGEDRDGARDEVFEDRARHVLTHITPPGQIPDQ
jgi:hypothetical protein